MASNLKHYYLGLAVFIVLLVLAAVSRNVLVGFMAGAISTYVVIATANRRATRGDDPDHEFFKATMQAAIEHKRSACLKKAERPFADAIAKMADSYKDFTRENHPYAVMGSASMDAMGHALLTMSMGDWEKFYWGYVGWAKGTEKCPYRGREEENARGAMLMSLKHECESAERRYLAVKELKSE